MSAANLGESTEESCLLAGLLRKGHALGEEGGVSHSGGGVRRANLGESAEESYVIVGYDEWGGEGEEEEEEEEEQRQDVDVEVVEGRPAKRLKSCQ
jgi:hypothetical protein